jgi:hypothetical protein
VDLPTFQLTFPTFKKTNPAFVEATLARASRMISPLVWGAQTDDGIGLLTAHWLSQDPLGTTTALESGASQRTVYGDQYEAMKRAVVGGGFGVSGVSGGGWPWGGGGGCIP